MAQTPEYIRNLELFDRLESPLRAVPPDNNAVPEDLDFANVQTVITGSSVWAFESALSEQQKDDVTMSTLFALRAANEFDPFGDVLNWYRKYVEVLSNLGWNITQNAFLLNQASESTFRIDGEALRAIQQIAVGGGLNTLMEGLASLESVDNEEQLDLFELHSTSGTVGNFQLGAAEISDTGELTMHLGHYYIRTVERRRRFLFITWSTTEAELFMSVQRVVLAEPFYAAVRDDVKRRAIASTVRYVAEVPLADSTA